MSAKRSIEGELTTIAYVVDMENDIIREIDNSGENVFGQSSNKTDILIQYFSVRYENNQYFITDLSSTTTNIIVNGLKLPKNTLRQTLINNGDSISIIDDGRRKSYHFKFNVNQTYKKRRSDNESIQDSEAKVIRKLKSEILKMNNLNKQLKKKVSNLKLQLESDSKEQEMGKKIFHDFENEFTCTICNEVIFKATTLNCSHTFCEKCIEEWRRVNNTCPLCRSTIRTHNRCQALDNCLPKMVEMQKKLYEPKQLPSRASVAAPTSTLSRSLNAPTSTSSRSLNAPTSTSSRSLNAPTSTSSRSLDAPTSTSSRSLNADSRVTITNTQVSPRLDAVLVIDLTR